MKWKQPPDIKIYEALGAVADGRVSEQGSTARVYSSSGNKYYDVEYDASAGAIMTNDNGSYWKGYLGYPAIAYLMQVGVLSYDSILGSLLKNIAWKDINTKFKNDFTKTLEFITKDFSSEDRDSLAHYIRKIQEEIEVLGLTLLGKKKAPPQGY